MPDKKIDMFQIMKDTLDDHIGKAEFVKAFKEVIDFVKNIDKRLTSDFGQLSDKIDSQLSGFKQLSDKTASQLLELQNSKEDIDRRLTSGFKQLSDKTDSRLLELQNSKDEIPALDESQIVSNVLTQIKLPEQKEVILDNPEEIRNKLEVLQGDERLDKSAIKGLDDELQKISHKASTRIQTPAKAFMIHIADCSSQCNGVTKTFNVGGSHRGIIGVYSTEFPIHFRPIIDYTETVNGLTLTSEVSAPAAGQSFIIQFLK